MIFHYDTGLWGMDVRFSTPIKRICLRHTNVYIWYAYIHGQYIFISGLSRLSKVLLYILFIAAIHKYLCLYFVKYISFEWFSNILQSNNIQSIWNIIIWLRNWHQFIFLYYWSYLFLENCIRSSKYN